MKVNDQMIVYEVNDLKSSGESKFYYAIRNNQIVKLDKDKNDDEIKPVQYYLLFFFILCCFIISLFILFYFF